MSKKGHTGAPSQKTIKGGGSDVVTSFSGAKTASATPNPPAPQKAQQGIIYRRGK